MVLVVFLLNFFKTPSWYPLKIRHLQEESQLSMKMILQQRSIYIIMKTCKNIAFEPMHSSKIIAPDILRMKLSISFWRCISPFEVFWEIWSEPRKKSYWELNWQWHILLGNNGFYGRKVPKMAKDWTWPKVWCWLLFDTISCLSQQARKLQATLVRNSAHRLTHSPE